MRILSITNFFPREGDYSQLFRGGRFFLFLILMAVSLASTSYAMEKGADIMNEKPEKDYPAATFAGGCFWCLESEFRSLDGIVYTVPGYSGGHVENPTYEQVTTGKTGHAEAVQIWYDPAKTSYSDLVDYFLGKAHDPTQLNRQGVDVGTQYRSAIFYHDEEQKKIAEEEMAKFNREKYGGKIVTELVPFEQFWPAEEYHQQYYEKYEEKTGQPHLRVLLKKKKDEL
jgi:peptide-methionine (S)-S-oxide reductase